METQTVSIAEGKKNLSRLIRSASASKREVVLTRHGAPVAVLMPYDSYLETKRGEGYRKIMEARAAYVRSGVKSDEIIDSSRKQLRRRP
ncbi:MAG: type II toxin-antitoxin system Phd/YefM family antitoxin [Candidatus Aminicenantales bacterium]